jgi:FMN reductase
MFAVISSSLNAHSRSRVLARAAHSEFAAASVTCEWLDLATLQLPPCDAGPCYSHPAVQQAAAVIRESQAILLATPIYNYDVSSTAKNLVELTGKAWQGKVVGFLASAGGQGSYMSLLGLANSLMLDFRSVIIPRFVFATEKAVADNQIVDPEISRRIGELVRQSIWMGNALAIQPPELA